MFFKKKPEHNIVLQKLLLLVIASEAIVFIFHK